MKKGWSVKIYLRRRYFGAEAYLCDGKELTMWKEERVFQKINNVSVNLEVRNSWVSSGAEFSSSQFGPSEGGER